MRKGKVDLSGARVRTFFYLCLLLLLVPACDGTQLPRVIASYPQGETGPPPLAQPPVAVTEAWVELSVRDVPRVAGQVSDLAARYGGVLLDEQHWGNRQGRRASLTLLLPDHRLHAFLRALQDVGAVQAQQLTESGVTARRDARVTVTLHETVPPRHGWDPTLTFSKAFAVFLSLFQALVDGLIWMVVVAGPFVLMGLGLLVVLRRLRRGQS